LEASLLPPDEKMNLSSSGFGIEYEYVTEDQLISAFEIADSNVNTASKGPRSNQTKDIVIEDINNNSTISLDDLKSIQGEGNIPKRSRRRKTSDKNTVSLDF
jgi:hypothetical protein